MTTTTPILSYTDLIQGVEPTFFASIGVAAALSLSVLGSAHGMLNVGSSMIGGAVRSPRIRSKNLVSAIFCEAIAIYGIIVSILLAQKLKNPLPELNWLEIVWSPWVYEVRCASWSIMWAGIMVGICNYNAGVAVGMIGSATALADCLNPSLFFKMLIVEIFADALGLYATIIGIVIAKPIPVLQSMALDTLTKA